MKFHEALFGKIFLIIFACIFLQAFYKGFVTPPSEGDSVDYHIPLAKSYLSGTILSPIENQAVSHTKYYPANTEAILSFFLVTGIPIGLFNVFGVIVLFAICLKLGMTFKLGIETSVIFAVTIATLNAVLRWSDTQIADIWFLIFFIAALILLESPRKTLNYFIKLGIVIGLLVGAKYSGPFVALILCLIYSRVFLKNLSLSRFFALAVPLVLLGASWYIRNILLTGNPLYPQAFLFFKGGKSAILNVTVIKVIIGPLQGLIGTINSFLSEFLVWSVTVPAVSVYALRSKKIRKGLPARLIILMLGLCAFFINLPSAYETHIMTSSFRYFLTAITCGILFVFIFFERNRRADLIYIISLASLVLVEFPLGYYPKLFLITVPVSIWIYYRGYESLAGIMRKFY